MSCATAAEISATPYPSLRRSFPALRLPRVAAVCINPVHESRPGTGQSDRISLARLARPARCGGAVLSRGATRVFNQRAGALCRVFNQLGIKQATQRNAGSQQLQQQQLTRARRRSATWCAAGHECARVLHRATAAPARALVAAAWCLAGRGRPYSRASPAWLRRRAGTE